MHSQRTRPPAFSRLPRPARAFLVTSLAVALAGSVLGVFQSQDELDLVLLAAIAVLCAAGNAFEVHAPGHHSLQPNLPLFIAGAAILAPAAIPLLALASFLPALLWRAERWYLPAFNVANYALAGFAVHALADFGGAPSGPTTVSGVASLLGGAFAFVLINHVLIGVAAAIARGARPLRALRAGLTLQETAASLFIDLALAATGACLAALWWTAPATLAFGIGPLTLVFGALSVPALRHKSRTDPKTGLFNFDHMQNELAAALATGKAGGKPFGVVMFDLDHLRLVNNRHGHLAGDELISGVAAAMQQVARDCGAAARFGGEEFCLLLRGADCEETARAAEQVRAAVEALDVVPTDGGKRWSTISAGVAVFPDHGEDVETLLRAADAALYDAKLGGRNRVRIAIPGGQPLSLRDLGDEGAPPVAFRVEAEQTLAAVAAGDVEDLAVAATVATDAPHRRLVPWYTGALVAAIAVIAVLADSHAVGEDPGLFLALVAAVVLLDAMRIDLFERLQTSPAAVPVLALAALFGPIGPIAGEAVIAAMRVVRRNHPPVQYAFDLGALGLSGAAAAAVFSAVSAQGADTLGAGALAGFTYYAVNIPLLAVVVSLSRGTSPLSNFREQLAWLLPHYVAFGTLAGLFVLAEDRMGMNALLLFGVPLAVLWVAEKQYLERSRRGVADLRATNEKLERSNERLKRLLGDNSALLERLQQSYVSTITSLARTIEAKDPYTGGHTERVARLTRELAIELGIGGDDLRAVEVGAVIHDVGKIGVPDATLLKPGPLDPDERDAMQRHPEISSYILADLDFPTIVKQMVRNHHERFDGTGYPDRLAGEEIPLAARILTVADALDAMTSDRPYRTAMPLAKAITIIDAERGTQFCPRVVDALHSCLSSRPEMVQEPAAA